MRPAERARLMLLRLQALESNYSHADVRRALHRYHEQGQLPAHGPLRDLVVTITADVRSAYATMHMVPPWEAQP